MIKHVLWGETQLKLGIKDALLVSNDNKFFMYSVDKVKDMMDFSLDKDATKKEYAEVVGATLLKLPIDKIYHIQRIQNNELISLVLSTS